MDGLGLNARLMFVWLASCAAMLAGTYQNPVIPGFHPDPSVVRVGGDYYLVNSTFQYFPAIIISHSKDLVHWEQIGHVFTKNEELDLTRFHDGCGIWAPDISWHDGEFYVFYCLVQLTRDRSVNTRGNYMVKSKSILGPWSRPVQLTEEGNDPSHFVDDDGFHYMLYAAGIPKGSATKIVRLSRDCTKVEEGPFWVEYGGEKRAPEGPHLFKKDGYYYHTMAASGGIYNGHHQLIARAKNIYGPYESSPHNPFIAQLDKDSPLQHQGHAKLVQTQNREWWALYLLQRRLGGFSQLGRETGLDRVDWRPDGWPVLNDGKGPSASNTAPDLPVVVYPASASDEFDGPALGVQWQFVRNPDFSMFSLTERPGHLRIYPGPFDVDTLLARNLILRREVSQSYVATTSLSFSSTNGAQAGLLCYYDTKCYIKFSVVGGAGRSLELEECRKGVKTTLTATPGVRPGPIVLRVEVNGLCRTFSYGYDGKNWIVAGRVPDASFLSDQGTPQWGFMGTMVGVFGVNGGSQKAAPADFDWFCHAPSQAAR
jgi:xylan 1,4-beta-xylosidase